MKFIFINLKFDYYDEKVESNTNQQHLLFYFSIPYVIFLYLIIICREHQMVNPIVLPTGNKLKIAVIIDFKHVKNVLITY